MVQAINPLDPRLMMQARMLGAQQGATEAQAMQQPIQALSGLLDTMDEKYLINLLAQGGLSNQEAANQFSSDFAQATPENVAQIAAQRAQALEAAGIDATDTRQIAQMGAVAPQQAMTAVNNLQSVIQDPRVQAYLARNPQRARSTIQAFTPQQTGMSDYMKERMKEDSKVREELRGDLRGRLKEFDTKLTSMETNYNKVQNLSKNIQSGNRMAVAQGLIALVKLGDPNSAVLTAEMEAALNLQSPSAILAQIKDMGVQGLFTDDNLNKALAQLDPLNPKNVDTGYIMDTANSLIGAQASSLNQEYDQAKELGSNLNASGIKSLFTEGREGRIEKINKIGALPQWVVDSGITEEDIQDTMMGNGWSRTRVISELEKARK